MKANHIKIILSTFLISGCTSMYIPNAQHTPVFKANHDVVLTGSFSNYQLAFTPAPHLGLMLNGYYRDSKYLSLHNGKTSDYSGTAKFIEGGIGYFTNYDNRNSFSIYGGWGKGFSSIHFSRANTSGMDPQSHYNRFFFQPNFSFGSEIIRCIASLRFSFVNFYDFNDQPLIYSATQNLAPFFFEPCFTIQLKLGVVYFQSQLQGSLATGELSDAYNGYTPYQSMPVINAGFGIHLNDLLKKD